MQTEKSRNDCIAVAIDSLKIIHQSLNLLASGKKMFYRVIALQLRMLLCDTTRRHGKIVNLSLLPGILPDLRIQATDGFGQPAVDGTKLSTSDWLQQKLFVNASSSPTIRQFIRQVCDQDGGAHFDPKNNPVFDQSERHRQIIENLGSLLIEAAAPDLNRLSTFQEEHS